MTFNLKRYSSEDIVSQKQKILNDISFKVTILMLEKFIKYHKTYIKLKIQVVLEIIHIEL